MEKRQFDITKVVKVPVYEIEANNWNPKKENTPQYKDLKKGIQRVGLRQALVVREVEWTKNSETEYRTVKYQLIDGQQRFNIAKELGYKEIWVYNEGFMSEEEAVEMTLWYQKQVPFEGLLLQNLVNKFPDITIPLLPKEKLPPPTDLSKLNVPTPKEESDFITFTIPMLRSQAEIIKQAIAALVAEYPNDKISNARALELICADYLSSKKQ